MSEFYERCPEILEKMNDIKTKKGINTWMIKTIMIDAWNTIKLVYSNFIIIFI